MSVINCIRSKDGLAFFADAATYSLDGKIMAIASKVLILTHASAVISVRGVSNLIVSLHGIVHRCSSFEAVLDALQANATFLDTSKLDNPQLASEAVIAGFSRARDIFEIYYLPGHHRDACCPAFKLTKIRGHCVLPEPDPEVAKQIGFELSADLDADRDGVNLMECQRRIKFGAGGFIERTDITRTGINSRIVKWWPDQVGRPVEPGHYQAPRKVPRRFLETSAALGRANGLHS